MPGHHLRRVGASAVSTIRQTRLMSSHFTLTTATRTLYTPSSKLQSTAAATSSPATPRPSTTTTTTARPSAPARTFTPREPPPPTARAISAEPPSTPLRDLSSSGLSDAPATLPNDTTAQVDWTNSFHGLSSQAFSAEAQAALLAPLDIDDIEVKPEGLIYLPEIKYRRILNKAFGPGGWGLAPRGETIVTAKCVTREYALVANGRLVSIARGEQDYFDPDGIPTATEGCKSNALMRCCKDLGVASELWDPRFIRKYFAQHAKEVWVEHAVSKKRKKIAMRKDDQARYPFKEVKGVVG